MPLGAVRCRSVSLGVSFGAVRCVVRCVVWRVVSEPLGTVRSVVSVCRLGVSFGAAGPRRLRLSAAKWRVSCAGRRPPGGDGPLPRGADRDRRTAGPDTAPARQETHRSRNVTVYCGLCAGGCESQLSLRSQHGYTQVRDVWGGGGPADRGAGRRGLAGVVLPPEVTATSQGQPSPRQVDARCEVSL